MPTPEWQAQEEQRQQHQEALQGFGGWLTWFLIGVTAAPVILIIGFFDEALKADYSGWATLRPNELRWAVMVVGIVYVLYAGLVAWSIRIAVLFYKKRRRFVREWKWFAVPLVALVLAVVVLDWAFPELDLGWTYRDLVIFALNTVLWWAYLSKSTRVRNTFVT